MMVLSGACASDATSSPALRAPSPPLYLFSVVGTSRCDVRAACSGATLSIASVGRIFVPPATTRAGTAQRAIPTIVLNTYPPLGARAGRGGSARRSTMYASAAACSRDGDFSRRFCSRSRRSLRSSNGLTPTERFALAYSFVVNTSAALLSARFHSKTPGAARSSSQSRPRLRSSS